MAGESPIERITECEKKRKKSNWGRKATATNSVLIKIHYSYAQLDSRPNY